MANYDAWLAKGRVPDFLIRWYVRRLCRDRLRAEPVSVEKRMELLANFVADLRKQPLAVEVDAANLQHYEVSTDFYKKVLGKRLKYSSCWFPATVRRGGASDHLDAAETAMLERTCEHADLKPGQRILELGCGWGSLSLFMAATYPACSITAVSNSSTQKAYIDEQAQAQGLTNLKVITADINHFAPDAQFDRVVSVEMFEHMRNYQILFSKIAEWLLPGGKLFFHIFTYDGTPYLYDAEDPGDWMARNFFAGGTMPCPDLPFYFADDFKVERVWRINGRHYQLTLEAWLQKMDRMKEEIYPLFEAEYAKKALMFWNHWRVFFMSCAEVFGYANGNRWFVSHYLLER